MIPSHYKENIYSYLIQFDVDMHIMIGKTINFFHGHTL